MIARITGLLEDVGDGVCLVAPGGEGGALAYEVLVPAFLGVELAPKRGRVVTLVTLQYLEGQGQGTSFVPRLVGFEDAVQRDFFELLTSVSGIGNRKALRTMSRPPAVIARAIHEKDAKLLATLPEIGKRMAEKVIAELTGKVEPFLHAGSSDRGAGVPAGAGAPVAEVKPQAFDGNPAAQDALLALMALGQTRAEAVESVTRALARLSQQGVTVTSGDELVAAVFGADVGQAAGGGAGGGGGSRKSPGGRTERR